MKYSLLPLPFDNEALEPYISGQTLKFHYSKHHQTYLDNLNNLKNGTLFEEADLYEIITKSNGTLFNNGAQVFNHAFYWSILGGKMHTDIPLQMVDIIKKYFISIENFNEEFKKSTLSLFGSGWTWLVKNGDELEILNTKNADTPICDGKIPLLVCDVWEHAYYLDYQNKRGDYVDNFLKIINWEKVLEYFNNNQDLHTFCNNFVIKEK